MHAFLRTALAATLVTAAAPVLAGPDLPMIRINPNVIATPHLKPGVADRIGTIRIQCVDLAVIAQESRSGSTTRIVFGVRNVSGVDYVSGANQQAVVLSSLGRTVQVGSFGNLSAGQARTWTVNVPNPFEFPSTYDVRYTTDPDIRIDGNRQNDDCNNRNDAGHVVVAAG